MNNTISHKSDSNNYITAGAVNTHFIHMETMYQNLGLTNMTEDVRYMDIINYLYKILTKLSVS